MGKEAQKREGIGEEKMIVILPLLFCMGDWMGGFFFLNLYPRLIWHFEWKKTADYSPCSLMILVLVAFMPASVESHSVPLSRSARLALPKNCS